MNLDLVKMLNSASHGMLDGGSLGPLEGYQAASAGAFGLTLLILGEQLDGAADKLTDENKALRELFAAAAPRVGGELAERLSAAAAGRDDSLRISALHAGNDALRALLIELHIWVEANDDESDLEGAIWAELLRSTERRRVSLAPL